VSQAAQVNLLVVWLDLVKRCETRCRRRCQKSFFGGRIKNL